MDAVASAILHGLSPALVVTSVGIVVVDGTVFLGAVMWQHYPGHADLRSHIVVFALSLIYFGLRTFRVHFV